MQSDAKWKVLDSDFGSEATWLEFTLFRNKGWMSAPQIASNPSASRNPSPELQDGRSPSDPNTQEISRDGLHPIEETGFPNHDIQEAT